MLTARPTWVGKGLRILAIAAVIAAVALFYGYRQLTADIRTAAASTITVLHAQEAKRKLRVLEKAMQGQQRGFVRLTEPELNAYLREELDTPADAGGVKRCRILLQEDSLTWVCWVRTSVLGKEMHLVWQQSLAIVPSGGKWQLETRWMRVGKLEIPPRLWKVVMSEMQEAEARVRDQLPWLVEVPAVELSANEMSLTPELKLYSYPAIGVLGAKVEER